jgi:hypothetical protein
VDICLGLLHAVFAKQALARRQGLADCLLRHGLADRDKIGLRRRLDGGLSRRFDAGQNVRRFCEIAMTANLFQHQQRLNPDLPMVMMTDDRAADWVEAARRLPPGNLVVVRARDTASGGAWRQH